MIWFTADTHFGHNNIIKYSGRPFSSIEEHDETLIENWNNAVKPGDTIYHLGDFALCSTEKAQRILERLNGNIHLVRGNHEGAVKSLESKYFVTASDYVELKRRNKDYKLIVLSHYAHRVWNKWYHGSYHLYGHSHGGIEDQGFSTDVGVDRWCYAPVSLEELEQYMNQKKPR